MNRAQLFQKLYGQVEVALNLVSGGLMLCAARFFLKLYAPTFDDGPFFDLPLTLMLVRSFGYMIVTLGLVQYAAIRWGNQQLRQWFLVGLLLGDLFHLVVNGVFFGAVGMQSTALFTFIMPILLGISRGYFLLTGVPDLEITQPQQPTAAYPAAPLVPEPKAQPAIPATPQRKKFIGGSIGELSSAVGYDVRDLMVAGYEMDEIMEVAHGRITLDELFKQGPRKK